MTTPTSLADAARVRTAFLQGWEAAFYADDRFDWDRVASDSAYAAGHREQQFAAANGWDTTPFKKAFNSACYQQTGTIFLTGLPNRGQ